MERRCFNHLAIFFAKIKRVMPSFFLPLHLENKSVFVMKVKLTKSQIEKILADPEAAIKAGIKTNDPWWVIVLKVIAYAIGLILAGAATTSCAHVVAASAGMM